jgi:hypothetical protein
MAKMKFANNANTTLASSLTAVATSMSVTSATKFPVLNPLAPVPEYFYCTLTDVATQTAIEIVKVTVTTGTTWTITRGQDGTTGTAFAAGDVVSLRLVRASLDLFPKLDEANTFTGTNTFSTPLAATNMTQSSGSTSGYLSSTDWTTFNGKAPGVTFTAGYVPFGQGTTTLNQSANLFWDNTNARLGINTVSPANSLTVYNAGANTTTSIALDTNLIAGLTVRKIGLTSAGGTVDSSVDFAFVNRTGGNASYLAFSTTLNNSNRNLERMRIHNTGGVSIGNTTDPGATNLSVGGAIGSALHFTSAGNTGVLANGGTFDVALPSAGQYLFVANQDGQTNGAFNNIAFVNAGSSTIVVTSLYSFGIGLSTPSALNVRITNNAGGSIYIHYSYIRIG